MRGLMSFSTNGQQTNTLEGLPAPTPHASLSPALQAPVRRTGTEGSRASPTCRWPSISGRRDAGWPAFLPYPGGLDYPVWPGELDTGRPRLYCGFLVSA